MGYILRIVQKVNIDSMENLMANNDQRIKFERIVKNIEESLIIFDDKKMELVNHQFLKLFKNIIIDLDQEIQEMNSKEEEHATKTQQIVKRIKAWFKKWCQRKNKQLESESEESEIITVQDSLLKAKIFIKFKSISETNHSD